MGLYSSGQRGKAVNLLPLRYVGSNPTGPTMDNLDVEQVLELMFNGYDLEWACDAVTESHEQSQVWRDELEHAAFIHREYYKVA